MTNKEKAVLDLLKGVMERTKDVDAFIKDQNLSFEECDYTINPDMKYPYLAGYYQGYINTAIHMLMSGEK